MKKVLLFLFVSLFVMSCSNDSESDLQEETGTEDVAAQTKFNNDVLPIIESKCATCHTTGPNTIYTSFSNSKANISGLINRINKDISDPLSMPQGGAKLSAAELSKFDELAALINQE